MLGEGGGEVDFAFGGVALKEFLEGVVVVAPEFGAYGDFGHSVGGDGAA